MAKRVNMTRGGRRVFAKKAQTTINSLRHQYIMRGGGYL